MNSVIRVVVLGIGMFAMALIGIVTTTSNAVAASGKAPYKIGFVTSLSGAVASSLAVSEKTAQARIDLQNSKGGVNGHMLQLIPADDGGTATQALTAAQGLVENKGIITLATTSYYTSAMASYLQSNGVPVVGADTDGPEWGTLPNTNMFGTEGYMSPKYPAYTTFAKEFKLSKATKIACVANNNPSGAATCNGFKLAAQKLGLQSVYTNTTLSFTTVDFTNLALAIKNSGANGVYVPLADNQSLPFMVALSQAGVHPKAEILLTGYEQSTLASAQYVAAGQGVIFNSFFTPVEVSNAGTSQMQAALKKYEGLSGVPGFEAYEGWVSADMAIQGLMGAGSNATRASVIGSLQKLKSYNANGVETSSLNFSKQLFGTGPTSYGANACAYFVKLQGKKFVVPSTGPICGVEVPNSAQS